MTTVKLQYSASWAAFNTILCLLLASRLGSVLATPTTTERAIWTSNSDPSAASVSTVTNSNTPTPESIVVSAGSLQNITFPPVLEGIVTEESPPTKSTFYRLTMTNTSWLALGNLLQLDPDFIYVKLNFLDITFDSDTAYLNDTPSVIDPYTWTWANGEVGYFLRSFPPNFFHFSLNTFSSSVYEITLNVSINIEKTFMKQNDSTKLLQISESLTNIFQKVSDRFNVTLEKFKLCQEFFDNRMYTGTSLAWLLSLHVYMYQSASLEVKCWSKDGTVQVEEKVEHSLWLTILYYTVVLVGTLYFPKIMLKIVIQKRPPIRDEFEKDNRMNINSDLPLGLHYYMFILGNSNPIIHSLRLIACISSVFVLAYLEDIILRFSDDRYTVRVTSAYRSTVDKDLYNISSVFLFTAFVPVIASLIVLQVFRKKEEKEEKEEKENKEEFCLEKEDNLFPDLKNTILPWNKTQEIFYKTFPCNKFYQWMRFRRSMSFDKRIVWDGLRNLLEEKLPDCLIVLATLCMLLPYSLFLFLIYSPSAYVFQWCLWYSLNGYHGYNHIKEWCSHIKDWCPSSSINMIKNWAIRISSTCKQGKCSILFRVLFILIFNVLLVSAYIRVVIGVASLVGDFVEYTFSGFILNVKFLDPSFYITFTIVSFTVSAVKNFYDSYKKFFVIIVESAIKHDESVCPERKVTKFATISEHLFWHITDELKPVHIDAIHRIGQLLVVTFITLAAFDVLEKVQLLGQISQSTHTIISVAIAIIFPYLNPSLVGNEDKQRHDIEDVLEGYVSDQGNKISEILDRYEKLCNACLTKMSENEAEYKKDLKKEIKSLYPDINMCNDHQREKTIDNAINEACKEFDIKNIPTSNSLSLKAHRYKLLLTKEPSEILRNQKEDISVQDKKESRFKTCVKKVTEKRKIDLEKVGEEAKSIIDIMTKLDKSVYHVYTHKIKAAALTFQTNIRKAISKETEEQKEFCKAVKKYLKVVYERDLKILRGLILQHLLCDVCKKDDSSGGSTDEQDREKSDDISLHNMEGSTTV